MMITVVLPPYTAVDSMLITIAPIELCIKIGYMDRKLLIPKDKELVCYGNGDTIEEAIRDFLYHLGNMWYSSRYRLCGEMHTKEILERYLSNICSSGEVTIPLTTPPAKR